MEEITLRLRQREKEDAELMAEGLKLEIQLTDANHRCESFFLDPLNVVSKEVVALVTFPIS